MALMHMNSSFASGKKTVLFDEHHGQLFHAEETGELDLSNLYSIFREEGWIVKTSRSEITDELLWTVDALVISGAMKPLNLREIEAIACFIEQGGKLGIMLHVGPPVSKLLHTLNVSISNGVIHEKEHIIGNYDIEFNVHNLSVHELTNEIKEFSIYGGWALLPTGNNARVIAQTTKNAWIDLNGDNQADAQQVFATVVVGSHGAGHFVVFSDDAIFQNKFIKDNNYLLGKNLARWLAK
jgi:hypothetical protein